MAHAHVSASSKELIGRPRYGTFIVADTTEWLVKTGWGVHDTVFGRKFYKWPGTPDTCVPIVLDVFPVAQATLVLVHGFARLEVMLPCRATRQQCQHEAAQHQLQPAQVRQLLG